MVLAISAPSNAEWYLQKHCPIGQSVVVHWTQKAGTHGLNGGTSYGTMSNTRVATRSGAGKKSYNTGEGSYFWNFQGRDDNDKAIVSNSSYGTCTRAI